MDAHTEASAHPAAALLLATEETLSSSDADEATPEQPAPAAEPETAQEAEQAAVRIPTLSLSGLMRLETMEHVDCYIDVLIQQNPEIRDELQTGLEGIEARMAEEEFIEGIVNDVLKDHSEFNEEGRLTLIFKLAQFKAFAFAQLFPDHTAAAAPATPTRRQYHARLTGTPPSSPRRSTRQKRRVGFAEETKVVVIDNLKRARKR